MVRIKKYGNRRLYDTEQSRYVNLEDLVSLIRDGGEIQVVDAKTNADLTREVLMQVLLEVQGGQALLPTGLLHRLIRYSGDNATTGIALRQLGAGLELLNTQIAQVERQLGWMTRPPKERSRPAEPGRAPEPQAETPPEPPPDEDDVEPPRRAGRGPSEKSAPKAESPAGERGAPERPAAERPGQKPEELDSLRARLAALEGRLKRS